MEVESLHCGMSIFSPQCYPCMGESCKKTVAEGYAIWGETRVGLKEPCVRWVTCGRHLMSVIE